MKVTGFTFIRNAVKFDFPIVEAITSILPICDDFVVAIGNSDDNTIDLINSLNSPKIKIIHTIWDDSLRTGGRVLAIETDKAFQSIDSDSDWAFYIQGDEVVHEKYLDTIYKSMQTWKDDKNVDGLLFHYKHFYGSYDYTGEAGSWYRKEIRVIKNNKNIFSYRDAQGFRKKENLKLNVKPIDAFIYHYGWVKDPKAMQNKQLYQHTLWHDDKWVDKNVRKAEEFDYSGLTALSKFNDTHPKVMQNRINNKNWKFDHDISKNQFSLKDKIKNFIENITGYRIGEYKNYRII